MHILNTSFSGNPNVGLFGVANNDICLLGNDVPDKILKEIEKALKVKAHRVSIAGTSMIGVFCVLTDDTILVPNLTFKDEIKELEKLGLDVVAVDSKLTALGNNILANSIGCLINPEYSKTAEKQIKKALKVNIETGTIAGLKTVGSLGQISNKGGLIHFECTEEEIKILEKLFEVELQTGSVNMGNPYISSGIISNDNGLVIGDASTGVELVDADKAFGFVDVR